MGRPLFVLPEEREEQEAARQVDLRAAQMRSPIRRSNFSDPRAASQIAQNANGLIRLNLMERLRDRERIAQGLEIEEPELLASQEDRVREIRNRYAQVQMQERMSHGDATTSIDSATQSILPRSITSAVNSVDDATEGEGNADAHTGNEHGLITHLTAHQLHELIHSPFSPLQIPLPSNAHSRGGTDPLEARSTTAVNVPNNTASPPYIPDAQPVPRSSRMPGSNRVRLDTLPDQLFAETPGMSATDRQGRRERREQLDTTHSPTEDVPNWATLQNSIPRDPRPPTASSSFASTSVPASAPTSVATESSTASPSPAHVSTSATTPDRSPIHTGNVLRPSVQEMSAVQNARGSRMSESRSQTSSRIGRAQSRLQPSQTSQTLPSANSSLLERASLMTFRAFSTMQDHERQELLCLLEPLLTNMVECEAVSDAWLARLGLQRI